MGTVGPIIFILLVLCNTWIRKPSAYRWGKCGVKLMHVPMVNLRNFLTRDQRRIRSLSLQIIVAYTGQTRDYPT